MTVLARARAMSFFIEILLDPWNASAAKDAQTD
jgi:hypothetical protein